MNEKIKPQSIENRREKESRFDLYISKGIEHALKIIKNQYEDSKNSDNNLDYHNTLHTQNEIQRVDKILRTIMNADPSLITERDIKLGCLVGAFHDIINDNHPEPKQDNEFVKIMRKYHRGDNEKASAQKLIAFMQRANYKSTKEVFTKKDMEIGEEAHKATIPDFDSENYTAFQPHLDKNSSLIARAIALADLGSAGLDGKEAFLADGDNFFREENIDIANAVKNIENLNNEQKQYYKKRMLAWSEFQPKFAQGRKNLLDKELEGVPNTAKNAVRALFNKFDESIQAAQERAENRKIMSFEELVQDMGYE